MSFLKDLGTKIVDAGKVLKKSYGPLAKLDSGAGHFTGENPWSLGGVYRYPYDVGNNSLYPHTVEFHFFQPQPTGVRKDTGSSSNAGATYRGNEDILQGYRQRNNLPAETRFADNLRYKDTQPEVFSDWRRRSELTNIVAMYIPRQGPQDTFNVNYSDIGITKAAGALGYLAEAGRSMAEAYRNRDNEEKPVNWATWIASATAAAVGASSTFGKVVGDAATLGEAGFQLMGGFASNPQMEVIFQGPAFRKFMFQFKMLPRDRKEADEMLKIIETFKYHASPAYMEVGGRFMVPPSYVDIVFNYNNKENDRMPMKMSTCVMTAVDMDYGGSTDQFVSFSDGTPLEIQMQLQFQELEIMHKDLRQQGY